MRRKRCSRPSLAEPTSGRCNYDLEWPRNFFILFLFFYAFLFFLLSFWLLSCYPSGVLPRGCTENGRCLSERDNETRDKTLQIPLLHPVHTNSLAVWTFLFLFFSRRCCRIVWRLHKLFAFSRYAGLLFASTSTFRRKFSGMFGASFV